jgi:hypothetical protein
VQEISYKTQWQEEGRFCRVLFMGASMGGGRTRHLSLLLHFRKDKFKKQGNVPNITTEINDIEKLFFCSQYSTDYCGN